MKALTVITVVVLAICIGCGGPKPEPELDVTRASEIKFPVRPPYTMTVGDVLTIKFFYYPAYDIVTTVRPDGIVSIPLIGEIMVEGMAPSQLEDIVRSRYSEALAEPEVSVIVTEFAEQRVFVFGEVNSPGVYELKGRMTVVDAVAMAGGLSERGQMDSIILIRKSQDGTFAGTRIDLEEILFSQQGDNTYLMPADIVHVPMTFIGKVDVFVDQYFNKISGFWYSYIAAREVTNPEGRFIFGR